MKREEGVKMYNKTGYVNKNVIATLIIIIIFLFIPTNYEAYALDTELYAEVEASESVFKFDTCISVTSTGNDELLSLINQERANVGVAPLQTNTYWQNQEKAKVGDSAENYIRGESNYKADQQSDKYYGETSQNIRVQAFDYDLTEIYSRAMEDKEKLPEGYKVNEDSFVQDAWRYLEMVDPNLKYMGAAGAIIDVGCNGVKDQEMVQGMALSEHSTASFTDGQQVLDGSIFTTYETDMANGSRISGIDESVLHYVSEEDPFDESTCLAERKCYYSDYVTNTNNLQGDEGPILTTWLGSPTGGGTSGSSSSVDATASYESPVTTGTGSYTSSASSNTEIGQETSSASSNEESAKASSSNKKNTSNDSKQKNKEDTKNRRTESIWLNDKTHKLQNYNSLTTAGISSILYFIKCIMLFSLIYIVGLIIYTFKKSINKN